MRAGDYAKDQFTQRGLTNAMLDPWGGLVKAKSLTINNTGGTDHLSFDAVGLPVFNLYRIPLDMKQEIITDVYDHYRKMILSRRRQL